MTDQGKSMHISQLTIMLPSMATLASLFMGVSAIVVLSDQRFLFAAILILMGSLLDVLDGQLAHRLNASTNMGKQLDSLADMVTFGVAPTILIYNLMLNVGVNEVVAVLASVMFALAGALRLARFNTQLSDRSAFFTGMPIPVASIFIITGSFWQHWTLNIWWIAIVAIVSLLMVSNIPYPKSKHILELPLLLWVLVLGLSLVSLELAGWRGVPFSVLMLYTICGPIYARATQKRWRFRRGSR